MHSAPRHRAHRRHWVQRALMGMAAALTVLLVVVIGLLWRFQGNIAALEVDLGIRPDNSASTDPATNLAPMNILLLGSDTREGLSEVSGGDEAVLGARSDTALLVHLSAARDYAVVVSIPRDSMVEFPDCPGVTKSVEDNSRTPSGQASSGGSSQNSQPAGQRSAGPGSSSSYADPSNSYTGSRAALRQFNMAYEEGGPGCTIRVVEKNTDIFIDHFAVVNFDGFKSMVEGLGGVEVCVPKAVKDTDSGLDIPAGISRLDGDQALAFVRTRHGYGNGSDLARIQLQQVFLSAMIRQATDSKLLLRPDRLVRFLDAATKSLATDPGMASISDLSGLARQVQNLPPDRIHFVTVPVAPYKPDPNRVVWAPQAEDLWEIIRTDGHLPGTGPPPEPAPKPTPVPADELIDPALVSVEVVNTTGIDGLGQQSADALAEQGFTATAVSGMNPGLRGSLVRYPVGRRPEAMTVAAAFPGAHVELDEKIDDGIVRVELGAGAPAVAAVPGARSTHLPKQPIGADPHDRQGSTQTSGPGTLDSEAADENDLCRNS